MEMIKAIQHRNNDRKWNRHLQLIIQHKKQLQSQRFSQENEMAEFYVHNGTSCMYLQFSSKYSCRRADNSGEHVPAKSCRCGSPVGASSVPADWL